MDKALSKPVSLAAVNPADIPSWPDGAERRGPLPLHLHVRAVHNFKTPDALQLGAAIVHGCDQFLTNDSRLSACTDIRVEVLP
jgi:hypothetical protein